MLIEYCKIKYLFQYGLICKATAATMAAAFAAVSAAAIAAGKALVDMAVEGAAYADTVLTEATV
ncbi:MAG: hypothetical protein IKM66_06905, partial [Clostridia bacterium]|nr:hypothetical protein [Clostridia bacterium]